ncbi:MAG: hypothetical protein AAFP77_01690 [Bacteroidota bacterium]
MKKSKLLDICSALDKKEWKTFQNSLTANATNQEQRVIILAKHLAKLSEQSFPAHRSTPEQIWAAVFSPAPFSYKGMSYLISDLTKRLEIFIGKQEQAQQELTTELFILEGLVKRRLEKSYQFRLAKTKKLLQKTQRESAQKWYYELWLAKIESYYFTAQNNRTTNPELQRQKNILDRYYLCANLELYCGILNEDRVLNHKTPLPDSPFTVQSEVAELGESPLIEIYQMLIDLLGRDEPDEALFDHYQAALFATAARIRKPELIDLYYYTINYCLYAINRGYRIYADRLLDLYQKGLDSKDLLLAGELSPWIYKNIVKLSLGLKRFAWAEKFILEFTDELPVQFREDALHFNLSDLYYHRQEYDKALELLSRVEFSDVFYKHGAKVMLLKIFFERHESEAFHSLLTSYKILLIREKKLTKNKIKPYQKFVNYAAKLAKIQTYDKERLRKLSTSLKQDIQGGVSDRSWLLNQIEKKIKQ